MRIALQAPGLQGDSTPEGLKSIDRALGSLREYDPDLGRLVELRLFAGFTQEDAARFLGLSPGATQRRWAEAKAYLVSVLGNLPKDSVDPQ